MKPDPEIKAVPTGISDSGRVAALAGVIAALTAFGLAQGLSYPLFTLLMQRQGYSPALIGLSAAVMPIGIILSAPLVPRLANIVGAPAVAIGCASLGALCFLLIGLMQDWVAWFVVRFFIGVAINPLYILGETWALGLAPPGKRGRVMGIFNAIMGSGYAAGPLALAAVGPDGWMPFSIGVCGFSLCALILLSVAPQLRASDGARDEHTETSGLLSFATTAPTLLLAVGASAAISMSAYSLLPVFGAGYGLAEATLATLVMALSIGNIILQIPLGFAAERFGGRAMMLACAGSTAFLRGDVADPDRIAGRLAAPRGSRRHRIRHLHDGARGTGRPVQGPDAGRRQRGVCRDVGDGRHRRSSGCRPPHGETRTDRPSFGHRLPLGLARCLFAVENEPAAQHLNRMARER